MEDIIRGGNLDVVKTLCLSLSKEDLDECLLLAIEYGHLEIVKYLVSIDAGIHENKDQPLEVAVSYGNTEIIQYLLDQGAPIDGHDDDCSPISIAASHGDLPVVLFLVDRGACIPSFVYDYLYQCKVYGQLDDKYRCIFDY